MNVNDLINENKHHKNKNVKYFVYARSITEYTDHSYKHLQKYYF